MPHLNVILEDTCPEKLASMVPHCSRALYASVQITLLPPSNRKNIKTNKKVFPLPSVFSAFSSEFYNAMLASESLCRIALPPQLP